MNKDFNFRSFHVRSINAATEAEKEKINRELKDLYASLNDEHKAAFNVELQKFLMGQYKTLSDDYEAIKGSRASLN